MLRDSLQSTSGSVNPSTWPEAFQVVGWWMIEESRPTMSSRRCTKSCHQAGSISFFSSTPRGP
jgi:hypothetical protein